MEGTSSRTQYVSETHSVGGSHLLSSLAHSILLLSYRTSLGETQESQVGRAAST